MLPYAWRSHKGRPQPVDLTSQLGALPGSLSRAEKGAAEPAAFQLQPRRKQAAAALNQDGLVTVYRAQRRSSDQGMMNLSNRNIE